MESLRSLPKVDALSRAPALDGFAERVRMEAARLAIDEARDLIRSGTGLNGHSIEDLARRRAVMLTTSTLTRAINLSGVVLHTGLGRARLAPAVVERVAEVAGQHVALEFDTETGKRGDRQLHVRDLLCKITGAEDAHVVNNAAAALILTLSALAKGGGVVLSRGQMVEIGGSFRMPDIVRESGCRLVEVGCTNKTRIADYERAVDENTAAILRCHPSNYKIIGFTEEPSLQDLSRVARECGLPLIDDMGTGCVIDTSRYGMVRVPTLQDSLAAGADVVTASGDKLLGGPQAGLIVGKGALVSKIRNHPLARALRVDKLTIAALEATLRLYSEGREREIPTITYLTRPLEEVRGLCAKLSSCLKASTVAPGVTEVGGGSAPGTGVATWRVGIPDKSPDALAARLRRATPSIIGRIEDGLLWLDPRTLDNEEVDSVCGVLRSL